MRTPTPTGVDETNTTAEKIIYFSTSTRPAFGRDRRLRRRHQRFRDTGRA